MQKTSVKVREGIVWEIPSGLHQRSADLPLPQLDGRNPIMRSRLRFQRLVANTLSSHWRHAHTAGLIWRSPSVWELPGDHCPRRRRRRTLQSLETATRWTGVICTAGGRTSAPIRETPTTAATAAAGWRRACRCDDKWCSISDRRQRYGWRRRFAIVDYGRTRRRRWDETTTFYVRPSNCSRKSPGASPRCDAAVGSEHRKLASVMSDANHSCSSQLCVCTETS